MEGWLLAVCGPRVFLPIESEATMMRVLFAAKVAFA